jgi:hypothetical protein
MVSSIVVRRSSFLWNNNVAMNVEPYRMYDINMLCLL